MRYDSSHYCSQPIQSKSLPYPNSSTLNQLGQWIAQQSRTTALMVVLGLGGAAWIATEAIAPQIAQAYTARVNIALDRQPNETYQALLRRAEVAARAATQRSLDQDILVTDVSVVVVAQNQGAVAPILSLQVSRPQWRKRPDAQYWTTYLPNARSLLQLPEVASTTGGPLGTPYYRQPTTTVTPNQSGTNNPASTRRRSNNGSGQQQPLNSAPSQPGTGTPGNTPGQPTNNPNLGQPNTGNPFSPQQPAYTGNPPGTANPVNPTGQSGSYPLGQPGVTAPQVQTTGGNPTYGQSSNGTANGVGNTPTNSTGQSTNNNSGQPGTARPLVQTSGGSPAPGSGLSPIPPTPASASPNVGPLQTPIPPTRVSP
jgi:hypothetical protein